MLKWKKTTKKLSNNTGYTIGLLKEIKKDENRVAIIPSDVKKLVEKGNKVIFELGCGENAGYSDKAYIDAGAEPRLISKIFEKSDIIVKVKTPEQYEPESFRDDQILFSYLHYDGNESLDGAEIIRENGTIAIAFEWVEEDGNKYPLLTPMSELTGIAGALKTLQLFRKINKRVLGNFSKEIEPATVMIVGLGNIGINALNVFMHQGMNIILVDKHPETIRERTSKIIPEYLWDNFKNQLKIIHSKENDYKNTKKQIEELLPELDILFFAAVRRPSFKEDHFIYKKMLNLMKPNSILIDAAANDNDLVETIQSYPETDLFYKVNDVIHYANDHIPSMIAHDASRILSNAIITYLLKMTSGDIIQEIIKNEALLKGTSIANGYYTHKYTCEKRGLKYVPAKDALLNSYEINLFSMGLHNIEENEIENRFFDDDDNLISDS